MSVRKQWRSDSDTALDLSYLAFLASKTHAEGQDGTGRGARGDGTPPTRSEVRAPARPPAASNTVVCRSGSRT